MANSFKVDVKGTKELANFLKKNKDLTPVKKIVAEAEILDVLEMSPEELWKETHKESGITKRFFDKYFKDREVAYAYKLGKITVYDTPVELAELGIKNAPQSFVYLKTSLA